MTFYVTILAFICGGALVFFAKNRWSHLEPHHVEAFSTAIRPLLAAHLADVSGQIACNIIVNPHRCWVQSPVITNDQQQRFIDDQAFAIYRTTMSTFTRGWLVRQSSSATIPFQDRVSAHARLQAQTQFRRGALPHKNTPTS